MRCGNKGKKSFDSEDDAIDHKNEIRKKDPDGTERLHAYFCPYCWKWHIGNKPIYSKHKSRRKRT